MARLNDTKTLVNHISWDCKCKLNSATWICKNKKMLIIQ